MATARNERKRSIMQRSGTVFADLGFSGRRLSQEKAARQSGIDQPKISAVSKYNLEGFSVERWMRFLALLYQDVEIVIRNKPRTRRAARVVMTGPEIMARSSLFFVRSMWYLHPSELPAPAGGHIGV